MDGKTGNTAGWPAAAVEIEAAARALHDLLHTQTADENSPQDEGLIQIISDEALADELTARLQRLKLALDAVE